ncbi:hypothetical protein SRABI13_04526 [Erwinia aphidicola]|nr:hypothetical protein SRABI13_04526 [Erwinia aphidicola]
MDFRHTLGIDISVAGVTGFNDLEVLSHTLPIWLIRRSLPGL